MDFIVDKLTNSIENIITGDSFKTEISVLTKDDLKSTTKKNGWLFNWRNEFKNPIRDIYKLTIFGNPSVIQGLVCIEVKEDHVYMHLVESAPFNKGKQKCIPEFPAIWWHLPPRYRSREDMKVMFRFCQKHNWSNITRRL